MHGIPVVVESECIQRDIQQPATSQGFGGEMKRKPLNWCVWVRYMGNKGNLCPWEKEAMFYRAGNFSAIFHARTYVHDRGWEKNRYRILPEGKRPK